ncbi:TY-Chap domain-containing protein [Nocardia sp. NPDC004582]
MFARRLATFLAGLPSRATLTLVATGNRYVQFQQFDINLSAELTGNYYLPEPISEAAAQLLRDLGWTAPTLQREIENWRRTLRWPITRADFEDLARSAARGLHEALGVGAPAELRATGWAETMALDLSLLSARPSRP